ncbi:MAG TPA: hypothetical protein VD993_02125 [Chitinophagaceae bacterium]|nr:hypothetical protein [Chitinophagaceae bacterium]
MLAVIAFLFFFVFSLFFIYSRLRRRKITLSPFEITVVFGFKVFMGCLYGYLFQRFYGGDDTWMLHYGSIQEYRKLMGQPLQFFADLDLTASFKRNEGFAAGWYFLLSDLEYWIITKPLAIFNILSRGNYYVNIVFFNLLTFWGQYLVFKVFAARFPQRRRLLVFLVFLIPPISFWLSGIRPDAWIMVSIGVVLYYFHAWLSSKKIMHLLVCAVGMIGLVIFRSPMLLVLAPGLLAWLIAEKMRKPAWVVFASVYGIALIAFFGSSYISPNTNMLTYVVHRQQEFFRLKGNTVYELNRLEPTAASFFKTLPQAIGNTFLRPLPWEAKGLLQWMAALETFIVWLLLLTSILRKKSAYWKSSSIIWLSIFFGVGLYLFIGFTVPFPGAIARYKVIPELLLIIAFVMGRRTY